MSKNPSEPAPIKQRFIACVQSTGRVGKSMVADGILSWLTFAGIPHAAIDTDVQHHTLSDRYKMHLLDATSSEDEFEQLLENLPESPTLIVDFPGNKTSKILEFADHFQMLNSFRASGIRPTLLIFTADDSTAKDSALETLDFFAMPLITCSLKIALGSKAIRSRRHRSMTSSLRATRLRWLFPGSRLEH